MKKTKTSYYCTACGNETPQWYGKCPACGAWGTVEEHVQAAAPAPGRAAAASREPKKLSQVMGGDEIRFSTGIGELDRVLGGGAVLGSLVLISGAPGIGKSTLLLQICSELCRFRSVLYVSGEESEKQLKMRAMRLGLNSDALMVLAETNLSQVLTIAGEQKPDILIVDWLFCSCANPPGSPYLWLAT